MARFEDVLVLKDKVTETLNKVVDAMKKQTEASAKLQNKLSGLQNVYKRTTTDAKKTIQTISAVYSAATIAVTGTVMLANKVADVGDRIDKTSQKIGMSRKAFQEWDYIMSQNGGSVESLQMGFKTLTTQIENVQKGSKDSIKAFSALGVSVKDSNGQLRSQDAIFNDSIRALQKIKNPTQKAMLANRLFGRSAAELRPLLNQEAEAVDELRAKANKMGLIISDKDIDNAVKYKDTMDTFNRVMSAKFATGMMSVLPQLTTMLETLMPIVQQTSAELAKFYKENEAEFQFMGNSFNFVITKAIPATINGLLKVASATVNVFRTIGGVIGNVVGTIISIPNYISTFINAATTAILKTIIAIQQKINEIIKTIIGKIETIVEFGQNLINDVKGGMQNITNNKTTTNNNTINNYNTVNNNTTNNNRYGIGFSSDLIAQGAM